VRSSAEGQLQISENAISDKDRAYRRRLVAAGLHQLIVALPGEQIAFLDDLKERHGLRNRSQALIQLIEQGREVTQQQ
jgi:hypothetical protein